jgi:hypothetical protein
MGSTTAKRPARHTVMVWIQLFEDQIWWGFRNTTMWLLSKPNSLAYLCNIMQLWWVQDYWDYWFVPGFDVLNILAAIVNLMQTYSACVPGVTSAFVCDELCELPLDLMLAVFRSTSATRLVISSDPFARIKIDQDCQNWPHCFPVLDQDPSRL